MAQETAFRLLDHLIKQVSDQDTELALEMTHRYGAGVSLAKYPAHLVVTIRQLPPELVAWFSALLSVRAQEILSHSRHVPSGLRRTSQWTRD